jgi:hypothetical protein
VRLAERLLIALIAGGHAQEEESFYPVGSAPRDVPDDVGDALVARAFDLADKFHAAAQKGRS